MAFDAFCYCKGRGGKDAKLDDPETFFGETHDEKMKAKGAFEIISFELGAENNINIGSMSGGGGAGKATFKEFTVTKKTDTASTSLFNCLVTGNHFHEVVVVLRRAGGPKNQFDQTYMAFTMRFVMVKDISWSGSDGDDICEETVVFEYGAIQIEYWPQLRTGERSSSKTMTQWNRVRNLATIEFG